MLNPFFLNGSKGEQGLIQSLVNEQLKMYGVEVYYIPRKYLKKNTVIKEVIQSEFTSAYPIEAYVDNYEGYGGQGTLLSKFGIQNNDDLTLIISRERYESYITPLIKNLPNIELAERPKEGDLVYFPLGDRLMEIKYVEHELPFYQLQKNYVYQLRCELFRYEDEVLDTGIDKIDDEIEQIGYIQTLGLIGSGSTATGNAGICSSGSIQKINITNMGRGYTSSPHVAFSSAPSGGVTAEGVVSITDQYIGCKGMGTGKVFSVCMTNTGCGYTVDPMVTFDAGGGVGAAATAGICTRGSIQFVNITSVGSGYTTNVDVTFSYPGDPGVGFQTATGTGVINSAGIVTYVCITNAGCGYTVLPDVVFSSPAGIGSDIGGSFIFNEIVIGQTTLTEARVKRYDASDNTLEISIVSGTYGVGETIIGQESSATHVIRTLTTDDIVTPYADNDNIEFAADQIIDFDTKNPFGMP
tara:strand:- start:3189 stop:4592 length:1404 start_codon:yes stop_codon:yes gene_type:complete